MRPSEIVHRFLASIGRPEAVAQYLRIFQETSKERFAQVFVSESVMQNSQSALLADLHFLRQLDLTPVLCLPSENLRKSLLSALADDFPIRPCNLAEAAKVAEGGDIPALLAGDASERGAIALALRARKVIYLVDQSGLQPEGQAVRSLVNLRTEFEGLAAPGVLRDEQRALFHEIRDLFAASDETFTVSVTSAQDLVRELFTVKGAGSLIRRGTAVQEISGYDDLDRERFSNLIQSAFDKQPAESFYRRPVLRIFLAANYRGAAVVEKQDIAPYLSKFAVDLRAQGEGIGGDLWRALCSGYERFFWRSRPGNPIANWYASQCDGMVRGPEWTVYWRGLNPSEIESAVVQATSAPVDFAELK
jgi:acetylglutamate synthase